jgi:hypothetical protein
VASGFSRKIAWPPSCTPICVLAYPKHLDTGFYFKKTFGRQLWQRYGYEHVIRHDEPTRAIIRYILENPIRAGLVPAVADYRFIGSSEYTVEQLVEYSRSSG